MTDPRIACVALSLCVACACRGAEPPRGDGVLDQAPISAIDVSDSPAPSAAPSEAASTMTTSAPEPTASAVAREPAAPPQGSLECRAHDGATIYELWVSFADHGLGTGTLRKQAGGGVEDVPLSVQSWKGSLLLDAPGSKNVMQTRGRLLQIERKLQVGEDWKTPWFDCDAK